MTHPKKGHYSDWKDNNKHDYRSISMNYAEQLKQEGYFAIDSHCHSSFSYDVPDTQETSPITIMQSQIALNLRPLITDHDTLNGYNHVIKSLQSSQKNKTENKDKQINVRSRYIIPAAEISIKPLHAKKIDLKKSLHTIHVNVFMLNKHQLADLKEIAVQERDLDEFVEYLKVNNLPYCYNHPFWHEVKEKMRWKYIPAIAKYYFDVLEINAGRTRPNNDMVMNIASRFRKGIIAGTDSHTGEIGGAITLAEGNNFEEFWQNILDMKSYIVRQDLTTRTIIKDTSATIRQILKARMDNPESSFHLITGVKELDSLGRILTSPTIKDNMILRNLMNTALQTVTFSAGRIIAWKLMVNKDKNFIKTREHKIRRIISKLHLMPIIQETKNIRLSRQINTYSPTCPDKQVRDN